MKNIYTNKLSFLHVSLLSVLMAGNFFMPSSTFGQTYYSRFSDPTDKYAVSSPFGTGCDATPVQNGVGLADNDENSYAYFEANISQPYTCSSPNYSFSTYLNLPPDNTSLKAGNQAGFKVRIPTSLSSDSLGKYLTIRTYLDNTLQESKTGNQLLGLDPSQSHINWFVYFVVSKPYNRIELLVNSAIIQLNTNFEFDVYYALGATSIVLPAQIQNFSATTSGTIVNLTWQSLTETNVSAYSIERSSNGGASYSKIASQAARGSSNTTALYSYTDNILANGNYLYRIVTVNKDGSSSTTNAVAAVISGLRKLVLYPSVMKAGQNFIIKTSQQGMLTTQLFDAQGRLVKQQRAASAGQVSMSTSGLSSGVYTVKMTNASGEMLHAKFVVN